MLSTGIQVTSGRDANLRVTSVQYGPLELVTVSDIMV